MDYNYTEQRRLGTLVADAMMKKYAPAILAGSTAEEIHNERFAFIVGMSKYQPLPNREMLDFIFGPEKSLLEHTDQELRFCTFSPFRCIVLLNDFKDVCSPWVRELLEYKITSRMSKNLLKQWNFVGVNDNTPAMICVCCILAGEYFGNPTWKQVGLERLAQMEQMIEDRVFISEFTSTTYSPITLNAFAKLYAYTTDEDIKARALKIEQELWRQLFSVYHRDTFKAAGPYSRAYTVDTLAQTSQMRMLMYQVMGDKLEVNALNTLFRTESGFPGIQLHGMGQPIWFLECENCNFANTLYHCPPEYIDEALSRPYPVFVTGDAQLSPSADNHLVANYDSGVEGQGRVRTVDELMGQEDLFEYGAGVSEIFSYIDNYYTLGTCTKEFHNGVQTDSMYMLISKHSPATTQEDITSLFTRYEMNNIPSDECLKKDMGRKMAYSYMNDGMVLYSPKTHLTDICVPYGCKEGTDDICALKCKAIVDNRFGAIKSISTSSGKVLKVGDEVSSNEVIFIEFDKVYVALYPMTAGNTRTVRIEQENTLVSVSIIDYEGEMKHFPRKQLKLTASGFTVRARNVDEVKSFEAFKQDMSEYTITDSLEANLHTRFAVERQTKFVGKGITLESMYSPITEGIRFIRANGKLLRAKTKQ